MSVGPPRGAFRYPVDVYAKKGAAALCEPCISSDCWLASAGWVWLCRPAQTHRRCLPARRAGNRSTRFPVVSPSLVRPAGSSTSGPSACRGNVRKTPTATGKASSPAWTPASVPAAAAGPCASAKRDPAGWRVPRGCPVRSASCAAVFAMWHRARLRALPTGHRRAARKPRPHRSLPLLRHRPLHRPRRIAPLWRQPLCRRQPARWPRPQAAHRAALAATMPPAPLRRQAVHFRCGLRRPYGDCAVEPAPPACPRIRSAVAQ